MPTIVLNGEIAEIATPLTLLQLLEQLGQQEQRIAVECNGEIVPRSRYCETHLANGDCLEIIIAVGGG